MEITVSKGGLEGYDTGGGTRQRKWSEEELKELYALYPTTMIEDIVKILNRSYSSIRSRAHIEGIKAIRRFHKNSLKQSPYTHISKPELAYMAGMLDGEGTVYIYERPQDNGLVLRLQVANTNRDVMDWIRVRFEGRIDIRKAHDNCKEQYRWSLCNNSKSIHLLTALLPFLVIKKRKAQDALAFYAR